MTSFEAAAKLEYVRVFTTAPGSIVVIENGVSSPKTDASAVVAEPLIVA